MSVRIKGSSNVILQVKQSVKTDTYYSTVGDTYTLIPGLSVSITPSSSTSKILVLVTIGCTGSYSASFKLFRDGSVIDGATGDGAGSRPRQSARATFYDSNHPNTACISYIDSPGTTSQVTYAVGGTSYQSYGFVVNKSNNDTDTSNSYGGRAISTITVMEISA